MKRSLMQAWWRKHRRLRKLEERIVREGLGPDSNIWKRRDFAHNKLMDLSSLCLGIECAEANARSRSSRKNRELAEDISFLDFGASEIFGQEASPGG